MPAFFVQAAFRLKAGAAGSGLGVEQGQVCPSPPHRGEGRGNRPSRQTHREASSATRRAELAFGRAGGDEDEEVWMVWWSGDRHEAGPLLPMVRQGRGPGAEGSRRVG